MGIIDCITPKIDHDKSYGILGVTDAPSAAVLGTFGPVPIQTFERRIALSDLDTLTVGKICNADPIIPRPSDLLWLYGQLYTIPRICGWNGFLYALTSEKKYAISQIIPMPFFNASPTDYNTIYTTLLRAVDKCMKVKQKTCVVTFDQPHYQKARDFISSTSDPRLQSVVIRLGGFHMLMSFLGSIGYVMSESGLEESLSTIYAPLSVGKMMSGHAYSRAISSLGFG
ncbi:hypothetical protein JTB14_037840 [Gonioctena quinquepunctata]|nr:hypothetical protein JTB14_037840 [Gonioctena quinquepunctata]